MGARGPTEERMDARRVELEWGRILSRVSRERARIVVEQDGVPVAALISPRELALLKWLEVQREQDFAALKQTLEEIGEAFKDVPPDELQQEADRAVAQVRAETRQERERAQRTVGRR